MGVNRRQHHLVVPSRNSCLFFLVLGQSSSMDFFKKNPNLISEIFLDWNGKNAVTWSFSSCCCSISKASTVQQIYERLKDVQMNYCSKLLFLGDISRMLFFFPLWHLQKVDSLSLFCVRVVFQISEYLWTRASSTSWVVSFWILTPAKGATVSLVESAFQYLTGIK